MFAARIVAACGILQGPSLIDGEGLWTCAVLDADLVATGRTVVAVGTERFSPGTLVQIGGLDADDRGFDLQILARIVDLAVVPPPRADRPARVWLRSGPPIPPRAQPQNRH